MKNQIINCFFCLSRSSPRLGYPAPGGYDGLSLPNFLSPFESPGASYYGGDEGLYSGYQNQLSLLGYPGLGPAFRSYPPVPPNPGGYTTAVPVKVYKYQHTVREHKPLFPYVVP